MSTTTKTRPRKAVSESHIEVWAWFKSEDIFRKFADTPFAKNSDTVGAFEWVRGDYADDDPDGPVEAVFRFKHTCRNSGAHDSDARQFFHATRRNAFIAEGAAEVNSVELIGRKIISL